MADHRGALTPPDTSTRAFVKLASPLFVANLALVGTGTIDTVMAGRLSATDLAAVAVGTSIYISVYIGLMGVLQGLSPIAGHHYGAQRWRAIGDDLQQALWLSLTLAIIGLPLLLATDTWLTFAQVDAEVKSKCTAYLHATAYGLAAALAARAYVALYAAVSRPRITMVINLFALAAKAPLNAVFMYGYGSIPAMGGAGAGVSTAVLAWLMLVMNFGAWRFDSSFARFRSKSIHMPRLRRQRELLKLGIPIGLSVLFEVTSFTFMSVLIARLGTAAVAGHQIIANLIALLFMMPLALGIATSVLVAQALGAGDAHVARRAALRGLRLTISIAVAAAITVWLFREQIVGLYTIDAAVGSIAMSLLGLAAVFHVFDAGQGVAGFALRGYKNTLWPMVIYGVALWAIGLVGGFWIGLHATPFGPPRGPAGFWEAALLGIAIAAIALTCLTVVVSKRATRAQKRPGDPAF
ncbi:MAG TPA: MATE family efflux transporter [Burkholderiaceae bacterium]|nr:MATE family efflux transporter [Burkholderiaceae bacterium]